MKWQLGLQARAANIFPLASYETQACHITYNKH